MSTVPAQELDFSKLPRYEPRRFLDESADLGQKEQVVSFYRSLLGRPVASREELEAWIRDRSELEAALEEYSTILYIRMTCQTDDEQRAGDYRWFIETIVPAVRPLTDQLNLKYLGLRNVLALDARVYAIYDRNVKSDAELFNEANIPLQTAEALLSQEYQALSGGLTVSFQGQELTLPQMSKYLFETDRVVREDAWKGIARRRFTEKDKFDDLFDRMRRVRESIARNAGFTGFTDYQFRVYHRFDYTSRECKEYHASAEEWIVPLWKAILERRNKELRLPALRPWDLYVDPQGRPPLKPFSKTSELIDGALTVLTRTDAELGKQFSEIARLGLLDLASRKGKAPGGYQSTLTEARKPFIFMNAVGLDSDVRTLLHEAGHAFHALACAHQPIFPYRHAPMEFCEVASMAMELLAEEHLDVFYDRRDLERSHRSHLEDIVQTLVWVATVDAFQHWIYEHPGHSAPERGAAWLAIRQRFGGNFVDWSGLEQFHETAWHRQLHIFEAPFYYIEYAIAQLGALQLWLNAKRDRPAALAAYRRALALGGSRPLPELFTEAGLRFDFSSATIRPLITALKGELGL